MIILLTRKMPPNSRLKSQVCGGYLSKGFTKECRRSRIDLDEHIQSTIKEWINL